MGNMQNGKVKKLSNKIAITTAGLLTAVFTILIIYTALSTQKSLSKSISNEFQAMAKASGQQVQQILDVAENTALDIQSYLLKAYTMSDEGKRNLLGQNFFEGETAESVLQSNRNISAVYNAAISEMSSDVEKYMLETARHVAINNDDIAGVGVMFEPYAFDGNIKDYAFYISNGHGDKAVTPFGVYDDYSKQDFYKKAVESKATVFIDPYEFNGITMVTAAVPVYYKDSLKCVVMTDINVTNFEKIKNVNEQYPSMYTTILNQNGNVIFDTEAIENIGQNMTAFFADPQELEVVKAGIATEQVFRASITDSSRVMDAFFYPIKAGNQYWWCFTALSRSEMNFSIYTNIFWLSTLSIAALLLLAGMILFLLKRTLNPIDGIVAAAAAIAEGDLDVHLPSRSNDEIGMLSAAFDTTASRLRSIIGDANYLLESMAQGNFSVKTREERFYVGEFKDLLASMRKINTSLSNTISQINEASDQVSSGSGQVSSGAQALSQGATEQASAVEELAATISEISAKVGSNAQNAAQASQKAEVVGDELVDGNQQMQEMIRAMNEINQSSSEIGKIIKTIEDIAFQTNILALNAAVEAARAGAAGKGFAVVADEVRNLASKSAEASKNTSVLIQNSIRAVENGAKIADNTARSLLAIVDGAKEVASTVDMISAASQEQAAAISQVTQGVDQISNVVQTNSATAEESAAASEELSGQASMLKELVGRFILKQDESELIGAQNPNGDLF